MTHTDINGAAITVGQRVECLDIDNYGGLGTVLTLLEDSWCGVEWDRDAGLMYEHPTERLMIVECVEHVGGELLAVRP